MAWTQADIDTLKAAMATGALEVEFGAGPDRRVARYRNLADMRSLLAQMEAKVNGGSTVSPRFVYAAHSRD